jgi:hypothetical protein
MDLRYLRSSLVLPTAIARAVAPSHSPLRFAWARARSGGLGQDGRPLARAQPRWGV